MFEILNQKIAEVMSVLDSLKVSNSDLFKELDHLRRQSEQANAELKKELSHQKREFRKYVETLESQNSETLNI